MEIETVVEWLNRVKHGEFADWYADNEGLIRTQTGWLSYWERDALIIAQWYAERAPGTWLWALGMMKTGKAVRRSTWTTTAVLLQEQTSHPKRRFIWSSSGRDVMMEIWPDWYDAEDWQLAEEQP